ncbi:DUF4837 family protein [uncultured Bacteroides sp.]|uniref:DUF4837 family protein n=1 Tax=uncultured Bacteroides sp. TaxID=162156 RepID=UPI00260CFE49|nr:DUF4837 family protein [uncultured Bacteroides sp.]
MKKHLFYLSLLIVAIFLSSCGKGKKSVFTPTSIGRAYEILVVIDQDVWERPAGRALFDVLDSDVPGLPQSERSFRIMYTSPSNYDSTLKLIRNIIIAEINKDMYTQPKFKSAQNVYAAPQSILTIQAPDEATFAEFVTKNKQLIIDYFTHAEMNRQISVLENKHSDYVATKVKSMFDCDVWVPGELTSTKQGEDFFWAGTNAATGDQNFLIYSYPYTDKDTFTKEYFVHKRDSVLKVNIPGAREGMYMMTDSLMTDVRPISVQGEYALEARGLWRVKGDFMGGPFVSHVRLDRTNQRIIVSEIFIYSPDKLKRNLVRQMEASLYTLKLPSSRQVEVTIPTIVINTDSTNNK